MEKFQIGQLVQLTKGYWIRQYVQRYDERTVRDFFGVSSPEDPAVGEIIRKDNERGAGRVPVWRVKFNIDEPDSHSVLGIEETYLISRAPFVQQSFVDLDPNRRRGRW